MAERYVDANSGAAPQPGSWAGEEGAKLGFGPPPPDLEEEPKVTEYTPPGWTPEQDQPVETVPANLFPVEQDDHDAQYGKVEEEDSEDEDSEGGDTGDTGDTEEPAAEEPPPAPEEPEEPEEEEFSMENSKEELQEACRERGLDDSGTKQDLLARLNA